MPSWLRRRRSLVTQHRYTVILEREDDGGFHAFVPALKGCHTQGDTEDEALANAQEAIAAYFESRRARGEPMPTEELLISESSQAGG
jgi:predicted RNase H-like HicB family nuclease